MALARACHLPKQNFCFLRLGLWHFSVCLDCKAIHSSPYTFNLITLSSASRRYPISMQLINHPPILPKIKGWIAEKDQNVRCGEPPTPPIPSTPRPAGDLMILERNSLALIAHSYSFGKSSLVLFCGAVTCFMWLLRPVLGPAVAMERRSTWFIPPYLQLHLTHFNGGVVCYVSVFRI